MGEARASAIDTKAAEVMVEFWRAACVRHGITHAPHRDDDIAQSGLVAAIARGLAAARLAGAKEALEQVAKADCIYCPGEVVQRYEGDGLWWHPELPFGRSRRLCATPSSVNDALSRLRSSSSEPSVVSGEKEKRNG